MLYARYPEWHQTFHPSIIYMQVLVYDNPHQLFRVQPNLWSPSKRWKPGIYSTLITPTKSSTTQSSCTSLEPYNSSLQSTHPHDPSDQLQSNTYTKPSIVRSSLTSPESYNSSHTYRYITCQVLIHINHLTSLTINHLYDTSGRATKARHQTRTSRTGSIANTRTSDIHNLPSPTPTQPFWPASQSTTSQHHR